MKFRLFLFPRTETTMSTSAHSLPRSARRYCSLSAASATNSETRSTGMHWAERKASVWTRMKGVWQSL